MRKLLSTIGIALIFSAVAMAGSKIGENYNMGCGEVTTARPYVGVPGLYWIELSIERGQSSGVVSDTGLIKKIQNAKLNNDRICLGLEYDPEAETNFISYLKKI